MAIEVVEKGGDENVQIQMDVQGPNTATPQLTAVRCINTSDIPYFLTARRPDGLTVGGECLPQQTTAFPCPVDPAVNQFRVDKLPNGKWSGVDIDFRSMDTE